VRLSVVIPVHDAQARCAQALRSALASDLSELEVILVENCATERCASVAAEVGDARVVTVRLRPGHGMSRPRNVGVARARAPLVAFLDPDDLLKPDALSSAVSALERTHEAGFAFADFECVDEDGEIIRASGVAGFPASGSADQPLENNWRLIRQGSLARALLYGSFPRISGLVVRRAILADIGPFDEVAVGCAALDLLFRLAHRCDALYSSHIAHSHRNGPAGRAGDGSAASKDCISVLRRERARWSDRAARRQLNRLIAHKLGSIAGDEHRRRHRLRSGAMYAYAFAISPEPRWLSGMLRSILY
jgi:glycosyltransferase involved in cell wall biosynthesis